MDQQDLGQTYTSYTFNPNSIITANNLKGKLLGLEEKILQLAKEINNENKAVQKNGNTRDEVQDYLKKTSKELSDKITGELDNVQEEMNNHFANQKSENARLQKEIAGLKDEKKQLQDLLMGLQRRITDLEAQAGIISTIPNHTV
jgi:chromosome segregation ATPase